MIFIWVMWIDEFVLVVNSLVYLVVLGEYNVLFESYIYVVGVYGLVFGDLVDFCYYYFEDVVLWV